MARQVIRAEVDAGRVASRFRLRASRVRPAIYEEMTTNLAPRVRRIYQVVAPKRSRRLMGSITAIVAGTSMEVVSPVADPTSGYHYTGVTRFGHKVARIYPVRARALATPWGPRASVRGYKPAGDWAQRGHPGAREEVRSSGRRIVRALA